MTTLNELEEKAKKANVPTTEVEPWMDLHSRSRSYWDAASPATILALCAQVREMREALEFISCEGMDDADFYHEEDITSGTIAMANRARDVLARYPLDGELK